MDTRHIIINALLFQLVWFSCVFLKLEWAAIFLLVMLLHSIKYLMDKLNLIVVVASLVLGLTMDSMLSVYSFYSFSEPAWQLLLGFGPSSGAYIPLWLIMIWLGFSLALPHAMGWLLNMKGLFVATMTGLAPMSYMVGRQLNVIEFSNADLPIIAAAWCIWSCLILLVKHYASSRTAELESLEGVEHVK